MRSRSPWIVLASALACAGCETEFTTVAPEVSTESQVLGPGRGTGDAYVFFFTPSYNVLFVGWGGRAEAACDAARGCVPGGTALSGVTLQEEWTWFLVGTRRRLHVSGDVVVDR